MIFATDRLGPDTWLNARYLQHAALQFRHRSVRTLQADGKRVFLTKEVYDAAMRTGWTADLTADSHRAQYELVERPDWNDQRLEIVRILLWDDAQLREREILEMIDELHALFAVPVFVLDPAKAPPAPHGIDEFLLGIRPTGDAPNSFGLIKPEDRVELLGRPQSRDLKVYFDRLLAHGDLKCLRRLCNPGS